MSQLDKDKEALDLTPNQHHHRLMRRIIKYSDRSKEIEKIDLKTCNIKNTRSLFDDYLSQWEVTMNIHEYCGLESSTHRMLGRRQMCACRHAIEEEHGIRNDASKMMAVIGSECIKYFKPEQIAAWKANRKQGNTTKIDTCCSNKRKFEEYMCTHPTLSALVLRRICARVCSVTQKSLTKVKREELIDLIKNGFGVAAAEEEREAASKRTIAALWEKVLADAVKVKMELKAKMEESFRDYFKDNEVLEVQTYKSCGYHLDSLLPIRFLGVEFIGARIEVITADAITCELFPQTTTPNGDIPYLQIHQDKPILSSCARKHATACTLCPRCVVCGAPSKVVPNDERDGDKWHCDKCKRDVYPPSIQSQVPCMRCRALNLNIRISKSKANFARKYYSCPKCDIKSPWHRWV